jgi:hypothetical protein
MNWLEQIAPTIATCLGGPLAGLAVTAISKVIGVLPEEVKDVIDNGKLTADQIALIRQEEIRFKQQTLEMGLNFEKLDVEDRKSARDMQATTRSRTPDILSGVITIGFFGILIAMLMGYPSKDSQPLLIMLGSLGTAWISVVAFWFGSTNSSQKKDVMLYNSTPAK